MQVEYSGVWNTAYFYYCLRFLLSEGNIYRLVNVNKYKYKSIILAGLYMLSLFYILFTWQYLF